MSPYKNPEDKLRRSREYKAENRDKIRENQRKRTQNLTKDQKAAYKQTSDAWRKNNKEDINAKRRERKAKHKQHLIDMLGGKCCGCGTTENLQFDHLDRKTKEFNISNHLAGKLEKLEEEAKKCQLLCKSCHQVKTLVNHDCEHITYGQKVIEVRKEGNRTIVTLEELPGTP